MYKKPTPINNYDLNDAILPNGDDLWFPFPDPTLDLGGTGIVADDMITVSAIIVDVDNEPIPATIVDINNNTVWTESGFDGSFSLTVRANTILEISSVGFAPKKIMASGIGRTILLAMDEDNSLDTVDLGDIHTSTPITPPGTPKKKNYGWQIFAGIITLGTLGALFNKKERKRMALAGGKKKKPTVKKKSSKKKKNSKSKSKKKVKS